MKRHSLQTMREILSMVAFDAKGSAEYGYMLPVPGSGLYTRVKKNGYRFITDSNTGKEYPEHRLVFLEVHNWLPDMIDHIDGNTLNNDPSNLRAADATSNQWNRKVGKNSATGYKGVGILPCGKFRARIQANGKRYNIGTFLTARDAAIAINAAMAQLHGNFAYYNVV